MRSDESLPIGPKSMTGYGRRAVERDGRQIAVELKAVNHRFLDLSFRMPRALGFLEDAARKRIGASVARGHLDVSASYRNSRPDSKDVLVDTALLLAYDRALHRAGEALSGESDGAAADDRSLMALAQLPGVLTVAESEEDAAALESLFLEALDGALADFAASRAREGEAMRADMSARADALAALVTEIDGAYREAAAAYADKLRDRIRALMEGAAPDEARILQEAALMADRSAVFEETVRLGAHIESLRALLSAAEPVGRKLDFLIQEFNRETNTISSKSQDLRLTNLALEAKSEIEKLREQAQNVE